jgi:Domain of unknown function (DUF4190)/zinc-ribbon domain
MFCSNCGANVPDTSAFCPQCGKSAAPAPSAQTAEPSAPQTPAQAAPPAPTSPSPVVYGQSVPQGYAALPQSDSTAMVSLILGVLSIFAFSILTGIPAIILGNNARKNIRNSGGRLTGDGLAVVGIILGWVSVGFAVIGILLVVIFVLGALSSIH